MHDIEIIFGDSFFHQNPGIEGIDHRFEADLKESFDRENIKVTAIRYALNSAGGIIFFNGGVVDSKHPEKAFIDRTIDRAVEWFLNDHYESAAQSRPVLRLVK